MRKFRIRSGFLCSLLVVATAVISPQTHAGALEKLFAPKARLWPVWTRHGADSDRTIDHSAWTAFLAAYVREGADGINRVAYGSVSEADRASLKSYIDSLQSLPISDYTRREQLSYWINLYNALIVDVVLDHYPVDSIQDIKLSGGLFSRGPWKEKLVVIEDKALSLNDIEHRILRPIWKDPRLHYAVNCASIGCPNLIKEAFTGNNAESLLLKGAREYINHSRGVSIKDGQLYVSSIYSWFESDFGGSSAGVIDHLIGYATEPLSRELTGIKKISGDSYDWSLNDAIR